MLRSTTPDSGSLVYQQPHPDPSVSDLAINIAIDTDFIQFQPVFSLQDEKTKRVNPTVEISSSTSHITAQRTLINGDAGFHGSGGKNMNAGGTEFGKLGRTYRITTIQNPERSSSFQGAYLSRIPLSPAPILQLDCWDTEGNVIIPYDELPFLVCHLTLLTPNGEDATMVISPEPAHRGQTLAMLYGTLIASPVEMEDTSGAMGVYFCYPDVSVRYDGRWKLQATLLRITGGQPLDTAQTGEFQVVPNNDYTAPPLTELTKHFDAQGLVNFGLPRREW